MSERKRMKELRSNIENFEKSAPDKYFSIPMMVLFIVGLYPIDSKHTFIVKFLHSIYSWFVYLFFVILNLSTLLLALPTLENIDDLTDSISFVVNHVMANAKIAVFLIKKKDLLRLVEVIQGPKFRHIDCGGKFSANDLISDAVKTTYRAHFIFAVFVTGIVINSALSIGTRETEEISMDSDDNNNNNYDYYNYNNSMKIVRTLPFHSWYPFSPDESPIYEIVCGYQIIALFITAQIVMALDTIVVAFVIHITVQFEILSHNLRFIKAHGERTWSKNFSSSLIPVATSSSNIDFHDNYHADNLMKIIESDLEKHIAHHQAIIQMTKDLESVFTYQLLLQFICSLFAFCTILWQVSSTPILSTKFGSMLSYLGAVGFQLFMYCWFGNEMMLKSLSIADAAWDSRWHEMSSQRYSYGVEMIIHRAQKIIMITAGGFAGLTLENFMKISKGAYSCFAVLKKVDV